MISFVYWTYVVIMHRSEGLFQVWGCRFGVLRLVVEFGVLGRRD